MLNPYWIMLYSFEIHSWFQLANFFHIFAYDDEIDVIIFSFAFFFFSGFECTGQLSLFISGKIFLRKFERTIWDWGSLGERVFDYCPESFTVDFGI